MLYLFNGFRLDSGGSTVAPWTTDRVSIHDLVARLTDGQKVSMTLFRSGKQIDMNFTYSMQPAYAVRWQYPAYEPIDYEMLGGMVIMQLTDNHISMFLPQSPELVEYLKIENKIEPTLIISSVISGSYAYQIGSIRPGQIITRINGKPVGTLEQLRAAVVHSNDTGYLTMHTTDNMFVVLSFEYLLSDEQRLAKDFNYPLSPFIQSLLDVIRSTKKTK